MTNTIASERKLLGWSQEKLASKTGRTRSTISRWESNPSKIDGCDLKKLADLFGCSVDYLLGRTAERTSCAKAS